MSRPWNLLPVHLVSSFLVRETVLIIYVSTCHVASAVLWALDCSSESPRVLWGRCLRLGKLTWSGKDSLSCNGLEKSWHLKQSQLTFGLTGFYLSVCCFEFLPSSPKNLYLLFRFLWCCFHVFPLGFEAVSFLDLDFFSYKCMYLHSIWVFLFFISLKMTTFVIYIYLKNEWAGEM